jgi:lantibiotic modifying enzyme
MKKVLRIGIAVICMVSLVVGYYAYLSRRNTTAKAEQTTDLSEVQAIINKNFDSDYPATARAVVKWYNRIITAYYGEEYSQDELEKMADQARMLMDDELLALNPRDTYLASLSLEIEDYHNRNRTIVSATISDSKEVQYKTVNGHECAFISVYYFVREGSTYDRTYEDFCLRKDSNGNWKILTWRLATKDEINGY